MLDRAEELEQTMEDGGSYMRGALGALLGALVGSIPFLALSLLSSLYSGWLGFVVSICAAKGYQRMRGARKTNYAMAMVAITSVLCILIGVWTSAVIGLMRDPQMATAASMAGVDPFIMANRIMAENIGLVIISYAIPVIVSVVGIVLVRRSLLSYTEPSLLRRAVAAAAETISGEDKVQLFFCDYKRTRGIRMTALLFFAPVFLLLIGAIVASSFASTAELGNELMIPILLGVLAALILTIVCSIGWLIYMWPVSRAGEYCYARDAKGTLWRVRLIQLNQHPSYQFTSSMGFSLINVKKMTPDMLSLLHASVMRAIQDVQSGRVFPGNPMTKIILPLADIQVENRRSWGWSCVYQNPQGKQTKLRVPNAYTGDFYPEGRLPPDEPDKPIR